MSTAPAAVPDVTSPALHRAVRYAKGLPGIKRQTPWASRSGRTSLAARLTVMAVVLYC